MTDAATPSRLSPEAELLVRNQVAAGLARAGTVVVAAFAILGTSLYFLAESVAREAISDSLPDLNQLAVTQAASLGELTGELRGFESEFDGFKKRAIEARTQIDALTELAEGFRSKLARADEIVEAVDKAGNDASSLLEDPKFQERFGAALANSRILPHTIVMWNQTQAPPLGWAICDGTLGTPDLRDTFVLGGVPGGVGERGGAATHTHTASVAESSATIMSDNADDRRVGAPKHSHAVSVSAASNLPPYYRLAFIMKLPD